MHALTLKCSVITSFNVITRVFPHRVLVMWGKYSSSMEEGSSFHQRLQPVNKRNISSYNLVENQVKESLRNNN